MSTQFVAKEWTTTAITRTDFKEGGQQYSQVWIESRTQEVGCTRVRYICSIDSMYPGQSRIVAELWTATSGWQEVMSFKGMDSTIMPFIKSTGYASAAVKENVINRLRDDYLRPAIAAFIG